MAAKSKIGSNRTPLGIDAAQGSRVGRGRTDASTTPLAVRTQGVALSAAVEEHIQTKLGARLGKYAVHIERVTARFEDINGPRGGIDTECRIKVVLESRPTILVSARGRDARRAFDAVIASLTRAVGSDLERAGHSERGSGARAARASSAKAASVKSASGKPTPSTAAAEPEPDAEPSAPKRPSRISTRKDQKGKRSGVGLQRRAQARTVSSKSKARAAAARGRGTG